MRRRLLILPLLAALGGCAALDGMAWEGEACFSNSQCIGGQQCSFGQCTWIPHFELDLEVTPLPSSGYLFQAVEKIDPSDTDPLRVLVAQPIQLDLESPVEAAARFTTAGDLRRARNFEATVDLATGDTTARGAVALMAGVRDGTSGALTPMAYDLSVEPMLAEACCGGAGTCTAPVSREGVVPTADSTFVLPLDPATPPVIVTGQVLVSQANWTPVENLQVQLFEPEAGVRSLASRTDADGHFCLAVVPPPPGATHRMTLRLGPSEARPTLEFTDLEIGGSDLDLGAFFTGDHGTPVTITGNTVLDSQQAPVAGVQVNLVGEVDPAGVYRQTALTDELGRFEVRLLAGRYLVSVQPPEDSTLASTRVEGFEVTADPTVSPTPLSVVLGPRPRLIGQVIDGQTELPVPEVEVVAELQTLPGETMPALTFRGRTDEAGSYALPVDPGTYTMHFRTPGGTGLPWSVGHAATVVEEDRQLDPVVLEAPVVYSGTVLGEDPASTTEPLGGSQVEVYGRTRDGRSHLVGSAWADEEGVFEALLPQSLASGNAP